MIGVARSALAVGVMAALPAFGAELTGDAERGAKVFRKCKACHQVGDAAKNRVGPILNKIVGGPVAAVDGFKYSSALSDLAADQPTWTPEALSAFLHKPKDYAPGTRMSFAGLKKERDRDDLIAFLAQEGGVPDAPQEAGFTVPAAVLSIEGDLEYGEYLASECTGCHQADGGAEGIPAIVGWPTEDFVTAMHAYRENHRDNQVMRMIAGRLSDEEIAGLAAYFNSLGE